MMDRLKSLFGIGEHEAGHRDVPERYDISVATCALLLEMSYIDGEFDEAERQRLLSVLSHGYGLDREHARVLLETSKKELEGSVDLWRFASVINKHYSIEEKMRIIETAWEIAYADGRLDKHEDYMAHKMAGLLRLSHKQLIEAKLKVKERYEAAKREGGK